MAAAVVYQQRGSNHYIYYSFHHLDRMCHQLPLSSSEAIELAACCLSTNGGGASHRRSTQTAATKGSGCSNKRKHKPSSPLSSQCCGHHSGSPPSHQAILLFWCLERPTRPVPRRHCLPLPPVSSASNPTSVLCLACQVVYTTYKHRHRRKYKQNCKCICISESSSDVIPQGFTM